MNSHQSTPTTSPRSPITKFFQHLLSPTKPTSQSPPFHSNHHHHHTNYTNNIHQVFNFFDDNGDGKITASELKKVGLSDEEAEMVVRSSDADGDGVLGFDDFVKMMNEGDEEELKRVFGMYAVKGGCVITPKSLKKMMRQLGQLTTVKDCKMMIGRFDGNGDGVLDFDEFKVMMSLKTVFLTAKLYGDMLCTDLRIEGLTP